MTSIPRPETQLHAGVDWLTCTARSPARVAALLDFGRDLVTQEVESGGLRKAFHFQGFSGWTSGGASCGFNGSSALVRLSGATARESAKAAIGLSDNVSRLDLQITVRADGCGPDMARRLYADFPRSGGGRGRPISRALIQTTAGGDSLYIGRRVSDAYGRIYNKSAEEKERTELPRWRYEVEYKRKQALAQAQAYRKAPSQEGYATARVYHWFADRHCAPPISPLDGCTDSGPSRGSADQARQLEWLKVGVRPVVMKLAALYGWPDVLALLGVPLSYTEKYVNESLCQAE